MADIVKELEAALPRLQKAVFSQSTGLLPDSKVTLRPLSGGREELSLVYNPSVKTGENYLEKLTEYKEKEKENL